MTSTAVRNGAAGIERRRDSASLLGRVRMLREDVALEAEEILARWEPMIERRSFLPSARNLACYIALRRRELRPLQLELMPWGLSSLGRCEARVLENLDAVIATLERLEDPGRGPRPEPDPDLFFRGHALLRDHTETALGPCRAGRDVRIMVTLPSEAATDHEVVLDMVRSGMDIARINCGHDDAATWVAMAAQVRRASAELGLPVRFCMDICGPRCRTGAVDLPHGGRVHTGERLLMGAEAPGSAEAGEGKGDGCVAHFQLSLPEALAQLSEGDSVWINDGKLGAVVERCDAASALLRVTHTGPKGAHLRPDKGVNFPDTELELAALTARDLRDLDTIARTADLIGYSFVQRVSDIRMLQDELAERLPQPEAVPVIAKIETQLAIRNLPELIVAAAGVQPLAVMIARGDLAVELGLRRMAEIQEELLWLCEAAHVPVIWATQVLDTLMHKGIAARAEVTDAAMGERAECVMLNKGPFAPEAIELLGDLLGRMEGHQFKKASRMRALHSW